MTQRLHEQKIGIFPNTTVQDPPGGLKNTRCHIDKMTTMSQGKLSPIFCIVVFRRERCETKEAVRKDAEAPWKCPCPACASQWRQQSLSAMTHMRWAHGQSGHESTDYTLHVVHFFVRGLQAWPIDLCSNKDAGKRERETPTLCGKRNRRNPKEQHTSCPLLKHTNLNMPSHFLFSLLSLLSLSALSSPTFFFFSFVLPSRCIVQIFLFFCTASPVIHLSLSSLSPLVSPPPLLPIFENCCVSTHQGDTYQAAFSFLSSSLLFSPLTSLLTPLSSHCSLLSSSRLFSFLFPCLSSLFSLSFCSASLPSVVSFSSLSPLTWPPSLLFLPVRPQASGDNFLAANFEVGALTTCSDMPSVPRRQSPQIPPKLFSGMEGGECASRAVKNLDVTLVPPAARSQRTVEAACCELPAPSTHRSFLFPCSFPVFCVVSLLFSAHSDSDYDGMEWNGFSWRSQGYERSSRLS